MRPKDIPVPKHQSAPVPMQQTDKAFEGMIKDLSDFDLNQTLSTDHPVAVDIDLVQKGVS